MLGEVLAHKRQNYEIIGESADGAETLDLVARHLPNLLLLDYNMPGVVRLSTFCKEVAQLRHAHSHCQWLCGGESRTCGGGRRGARIYFERRVYCRSLERDCHHSGGRSLGGPAPPATGISHLPRSGREGDGEPGAIKPARIAPSLLSLARDEQQGDQRSSLHQPEDRQEPPHPGLRQAGGKQPPAG